MYRKPLIFLLIFVILSPCFLFGENISQCDFLYSRFVGFGLTPQKQSLDGTENYQFPYNIIVKSKNQESSSIVLIPIKDALSISKQLQYISEYSTVICTANDDSLLFPTIPAGTETALEEYTQLDTKPVILYLSIKNNERFWSLTPGSNGLISPSYTFSKIKQALEQQNIYSYIEEGSLALYKLNIAKSDYVLSSLLDKGFPAIKLNFPLSEAYKLPNLVKSFINDYDLQNPNNKEVNYDTVTVFSKIFTISESTLTIIFVSIVGFSLFSICVLSFMFGRRKTAHKKTMLKYWYIAPLFLALTLLCLLIAQILTKWIFPQYEIFPQYGILIKLAISTLIFCLFYILRKGLKIPSRAFVYSYLLNIISLVNFFVFSALDLPLLILFGIEFIFIYISQGFKKTFLLIFATILLGIPFIPTLFGIFSTGDFSSLVFLVNGNFFVNLILSLLLLPFAFMIMRIILSVKRKHHIRRQIIKLIILIVVLLGFLTSVAIFNKFLEKKYPSANNTILFVETENELASFSLDSNDTIGFSDNKLTIQGLANILYYDISIHSDFIFPIYSANFPFNFLDSSNGATFNLTENPPKEFDLEFITEADEDFTIEIKVYAKDNNLYNTNSNKTIFTKNYTISNSKSMSNNIQQEKSL